MSLFLLSWMWLSGVSQAASPEEQAQLAELERVRGEIASEVHLYTFDLIDELVYTWTQKPVFDKPTDVVVASVTVPVGLGTGLEALMENHLSAVISENPSSHIRLVHCPTCNTMVVHSGPEGTVISRGLDNPKALQELGAATGRHALFIDVEAEGSFLVLRARLTELTPDLAIVWSHTISTSTATPALLREASDLKSAEEARKEYLDALRGRGPISVPLRVGIRTYSRLYDSGGTPPPPFIWLQSGVELGATNSRAWTASLIAGYSFIPQAYQGVLAQMRVNRLLTGRTRSLTKPDLYAFAGGAAITVWGPSTAAFQDDPLSADQLLAAADGDPPRSTFGTFQVGLDLRFGNRIGAATFLESIPQFANSDNINQYVNLFGIPWQSFGTEVTFWF